MNVIVSLVQAQGYRASKESPVIRYKAGIVEMPLEHAQAMGLMDRIVGYQEEIPALVEDDRSIEGLFDDPLHDTLYHAGYRTLGQLRNASPDQLRGIPGIGPANYEKIRNVIDNARR